jgi:long-chain acyl-CoA synthetase
VHKSGERAGGPSGAADERPPATPLEIFARRTGSSPGHTLVVTLEGRAFSYGEVASLAARTRRALERAGVERGGVVGLYAGNDPSFVVGSLAAWQQGCAVAGCGTQLPTAEARRLFALAGADVVLSTVAAGDAARLEAELRVATVLPIELDPAEGDGATSEVVAGAVGPEDIACVLFTSGTTGRPKGVPHRHSHLVAAARQMAGVYAKTAAFRPTPAPADRSPGVLFTPFGHLGGYMSLTFRMWLGRPLVLVPKFSVDAVRTLLTRYRLDALQLTPAAIHMLLEAEDRPVLEGLRYVTSGTAPLDPVLRGRFEEAFGIPVLQAYGMTEVGTIAQERLDDVRAGRRPPGSVGRVAAGVEVRILDEEGRELPPGAEGEIAVRSPTAAERYLGADAPVVDGFLRTGDVGRIDDGILCVTGRLQDKLVVGGFNVYPAEVEAAIRQFPSVSDVAVLGAPDNRLGEVPVAAVVWRDRPQPAELLADLRGRLAHYKIPRSFVSLDRIPRTSFGKVDRAALAALAAGAEVPGVPIGTVSSTAVPEEER